MRRNVFAAFLLGLVTVGSAVEFCGPADAEDQTPSSAPAGPKTESLEGTNAGDAKTVSLPNDVKLDLVWCPAGSFRMGSPASDRDADDDEKPQVDVTLSRGFWLGKTEITQSQWTSVLGTKPWSGKDNLKEGADYPAISISHGGDRAKPEKESALEFCVKLTERDRASGVISSSWEYRLPTEAEWEYACRAGTTTRYSFGDDRSKLQDYAWFDGNTWNAGKRYAHQVGEKLPNPWGLMDMHGNVWEWCQDSWASKAKLTRGRDPLGNSGSDRVFRGGCWFVTPGHCRSAYRDWFSPSTRSHDLGFRVALSAMSR